MVYLHLMLLFYFIIVTYCWVSAQVKFDQFVEQARVLHNYASILELLLRLRQCCDHPFLVMRSVAYLYSLLPGFLSMCQGLCCSVVMMLFWRVWSGSCQF